MTDRLNHRHEPTRLGWVVPYWLCLTTVLGVMVHECRDDAHASDVPPLIGPVRAALRDVRHVLDGTPRRVPSAALPGDGPACTLPLVEDAADDIPERVQVERAIAACDRFRGQVWRVVDPFLVLDVFRLERDLGAPQALLVGAYCVEASMRPRGRHAGRFLGDWRDGVARASGPFQLHENVWSGTCRGTHALPHDLLSAASCYWQEVLRVEAKARRVTQCAEADMLGVGEANAANVRRYGWRCDARSAHWQMMEIMK